MQNQKLGVIKLVSDVLVPIGINTIFCVDVSGSMYDSLGRMRSQLKNKLPELMGPDDTISIVWFSGKGQCGILQEIVKVKDLAKLQVLNSMIDKFLVPTGLTNFSDPLALTRQLVTKIKSDNSNPVSLVFLSDGYHNSGPWSEVVTEVEALGALLDSTTVIEYGNYADSEKLGYISDELGGSKISFEDFDDYSLAIENGLLNEKIGSAKSVDIAEIKKGLKYQFLFSYNPSVNGVTTYSSSRLDSIKVPQSVEEVFYINKIGDLTYSKESHTRYILSLYVLLEKNKIDDFEKLLYSLGNKEFTSEYERSYGKQALNSFKELLLSKVDESELFFNLDPAFRPSPKQYCVLNLIEDLMDDENFVLPYHEDFNYSRTGVKRVTKKLITNDVKMELIKSKSVKDITKIVDSIEVAKFIPNMNVEVPIKSITLNSERANISILFKVDGKVSLPSNSLGLLEVESFIFRNYMIVKDGILNMNQLPCRLTEGTLLKIKDKVKLVTYDNGVTTIDFSDLPITNRSLLTRVSAKQLALKSNELLHAQACNKYLKYLKKSVIDNDVKTQPNVDTQLSELLKEHGVSPYNGFSPKTEKEEVTDFYFTNSLVTKIEKFSSLPTIDKVIEKLQSGKGKLTPSEELIAFYVDKYRTLDLKAQNAIKFINAEIASTESKELLRLIAETKFSIIISRKWFIDLTPEENSIMISINGLDYKCSFEWKEERVEI